MSVYVIAIVRTLRNMTRIDIRCDCHAVSNNLASRIDYFSTCSISLKVLQELQNF